MLRSLLPLLLSLPLVFSLPHASRNSGPTCRYAPTYSQADILADPSSFLWDFFYWEGQFHQNNVGYNTANGMTYDGTLLDPTTGIHNTSEKHPFSAASKESLQIMVYAHVLNGDPWAQRFICPEAPDTAGEKVAGIMKTKLETYLRFNATFPGYGGYLPWFYSNETDLRPTFDWVNRVPALDNGELIWSVYAAIEVLESSGKSEWMDLASGWQQWLDYTKTTASRIFYNGTGRVCAVIDLHNQSLDPFDPAQNYTCEGTNLINDPYEGELFTWWLYLFGGLDDSNKEELWVEKRPQLVAVNYTGSWVNTSWDDTIAANYSAPVVSKTIQPITVQRGFWFSAHEQWKIMEMPYRDIDIVDRVYKNAERVRTCNSVLMGQNAGLFASVNNITSPIDGQIDGYISYAGVPSVANQTLQEQDVITPYGSFPTIYYNKTVGLAWYKNMLDGHGMQNLYGSTESERRDGTGVSAFVSWDSKITTVVSVLGGVTNFVRTKMKKDGIYSDFYRVTDREYSRVFGDAEGAAKLYGESVDFCLPDFTMPKGNITDFTSCN